MPYVLNVEPWGIIVSGRRRVNTNVADLQAFAILAYAMPRSEFFNSGLWAGLPDLVDAGQHMAFGVNNDRTCLSCGIHADHCLLGVRPVILLITRRTPHDEHCS